MDSRVCTAGMHIFNGNNSVAADNFFIYTLIDQDEEHADFIKRLRIENNLNERCGKLKIDNYIVEITVVENKKNGRCKPFSVEVRCQKGHRRGRRITW